MAKQAFQGHGYIWDGKNHKVLVNFNRLEGGVFIADSDHAKKLCESSPNCRPVNNSDVNKATAKEEERRAKVRKSNASADRG